MQLLHLVLLLPLAAASTVQPRDANTVYNDITGIDTAVRKLTLALNAYDGGITQSKPVFDATIDIHAINRKGFADANASGAFTSAESKRIVDHTDESVGKSIPASVKVLEAKKPLFDAAELSGVVESTILLLKVSCLLLHASYINVDALRRTITRLSVRQSD